MGILHGDSNLPVADYFLDGCDRNVLVDEPGCARVPCYMGGNLFGDTQVSAGLLYNLIVVSVAACTDESREFGPVLVV